MVKEETSEEPMEQSSLFEELTSSPWFAYTKIQRFHIFNLIHKITDGEHTARILGMLHFLHRRFPDELSLETLKNELYYASLHDVDEVAIGDIPGYIKDDLGNVEDVARNRLSDEYGLDQAAIDDILGAKEKTVLLKVLDNLDVLITLHDEWFTTHNNTVYSHIKGFEGYEDDNGDWRDWYEEDRIDEIRCTMPKIADFLLKLRNEIIREVKDSRKGSR